MRKAPSQPAPLCLWPQLGPCSSVPFCPEAAAQDRAGTEKGIKGKVPEGRLPMAPPPDEEAEAQKTFAKVHPMVI